MTGIHAAVCVEGRGGEGVAGGDGLTRKQAATGMIHVPEQAAASVCGSVPAETIDGSKISRVGEVESEGQAVSWEERQRDARLT